VTASLSIHSSLLSLDDKFICTSWNLAVNRHFNIRWG